MKNLHARLCWGGGRLCSQDNQSMPPASQPLRQYFGDSGVLFMTYNLLISMGSSASGHMTLAKWRRERKADQLGDDDDALYEVRGVARACPEAAHPSSLTAFRAGWQVATSTGQKSSRSACMVCITSLCT